MDVSLESVRLDVDTELFGEKQPERVNEMVRELVALVYQRIGAIDELDVVIFLLQRRQVGIVLPQPRARSTHVRLKLTRKGEVQVADRGGQHDDVTGRSKMF